MGDSSDLGWWPCGVGISWKVNKDLASAWNSHLATVDGEIELWSRGSWGAYNGELHECWQQTKKSWHTLEEPT
jgi:hypothetical protein